MRTLKQILFIACLFAASCTNEDLDAARAAELIKKDYPYPKVLEYYIFCSDPMYAKRMLDAGFEEKGLVSIVRNQKLEDIGEPLITFKDAARPYLLPTSEKDKKNKIQKVKIGTEDFDRVVDIKINSDGKKAIVTYNTIWNNNNLALLYHNPLIREKEHKAHFLRTKDGWCVVNAMEFESL